MPRNINSIDPLVSAAHVAGSLRDHADTFDRWVKEIQELPDGPTKLQRLQWLKDELADWVDFLQ